MPEPRYKSAIQWEPLPYLVVFVLVVVAGSIPPSAAPVAFGIAAGLAGVSIVYFIVAFVSYGRRARGNPDPDGNLTTLDGIRIVDAPHDDAATAPFVAVADVHRHQPSIEISLAQGGDRPAAVLVPRASRWLSPRYRVGVQLIGGGVIKHAGFLPEAAERRWNDELGALRSAGGYARVPARIRGTERPYTVDVDVSGLAQALAAARPR